MPIRTPIPRLFSNRFRGAETELNQNEFKTIKKDVKWAVEAQKVEEMKKDESDDEIEMVGIVTNDKRVFKCIKKEDNKPKIKGKIAYKSS